MELNQKPYVVVRTYSAGVHCGLLERREGKDVTLSSARRIWSWCGANTLHEISLHGVGAGSRVSEMVDEIVLTEAIEVIACTKQGKESLEAGGWS